MTFTSILPNTPRRYAFAGSAAGALAPLTWFALTAASDGAAEALRLSYSTPIFGLLAGFPLLAAGYGYFAGRHHDDVHRLVEEMAGREDVISREMRRDPLTGAGNRQAFEKSVQGLAEGGDLAGCSLLLIDLDRFKFVNDSMGHDAGDELLVEFALRVTNILGEEGELYRLGGDEFAAILGRTPSDTQIAEICRRIEQASEQTFLLSAGRATIGVSIGITRFDNLDVSMAEPLKRADIALYKAKERLESAHVFFDADLAREAGEARQMERDLMRAVGGGEFFLEYQPIVGAESRAVRAFEALLRWNHPERGLISPEDFIPLAEKSGLILQIGRYVVREACREAAHWPSPIGVAVNVAGDQFKDKTFVSFVQECLAETGLAPGRLTIEVTESVFTIDIDLLRENLALLRHIGVRIALDDFGTGFSSINNLKQFPIDHLKIDRSFSERMLSDRRDGELVELMHRLGSTFHVSTTVEGIETESQLAYVKALGVSEVQGYLISRPLKPEAVRDYFRSGDEKGKAFLYHKSA